MLNYVPYPGSNRLTFIDENTVYVFLVDLEVPDEHLKKLSCMLSCSERDRAERFHFAADRQAYIARHAAIRQILARFLNQKAEELSFTTGPHGKPQLDGLAPDLRLRFNISRSASICLCAVARGRDVGVDIELVREIENLESLVQSQFSPAESSEILSLPDELRREAFFRCWTRKEAFVKANGQGLSIPLDLFTVSVQLDAAVVETRFDPDEVDRWSLVDVSPAVDYIACVAVSRGDFTVSGWRWPITNET
jgi:4'-phosphopantetheinyl transferase